jgi:signal transduction histidine kinase
MLGVSQRPTVFNFASTRFFRTWPVAAAALGGLLILIAISVTATWRKTEEIFVQLDRLNAHHRRVEAALRRLRSEVHVSGIFVRDYLLDTTRASAPEYREQLSKFRSGHAATLGELRALSGPPSLQRIDSLAVRIDDYWEALDPLFDWTPGEKLARSAAFLRREVIPRRDAILAIAMEIEELNNANLSAERAAAERRREDFRDDLHRRLWRSLGLGFVVALVAVLRLRSLEKRSEEQRHVAERAEGQMRLLSQQLVAAQEEERKRLSRDLHDQVGQMLTALRMELGRAARARHGFDTQTSEALSECKRLVETTLRSVRDLLMGLRPSMLDDFGLEPALQWHVREFSRRYDLAVDLELSGELNSLPEQHRTCVYRIVQEALTNCARHAQATRITVRVTYEHGRLELSISDDGIGLDDNEMPGMGLLGMEERVRELDGVFRTRAVQPHGTEVTVALVVASNERSSPLAASAPG